ncbi:MAG: c-type cytochrome [Polaromonas sp.]|nr:c-type cytochrome [Polaromonas sp.]
MHKFMALPAVCSLLVHAGSAFADADMLKKFNCMACHAIDQKRFGPPLKDVAAKYADDTSAAAVPAKKIQAGGSGVRGELPMPALPQVSDADAKTLAEYILTLK